MLLMMMVMMLLLMLLMMLMMLMKPQQTRMGKTLVVVRVMGKSQGAGKGMRGGLGRRSGER